MNNKEIKTGIYYIDELLATGLNESEIGLLFSSVVHSDEGIQLYKKNIRKSAMLSKYTIVDLIESDIKPIDLYVSSKITCAGKHYLKMAVERVRNAGFKVNETNTDPVNE